MADSVHSAGDVYITKIGIVNNRQEFVDVSQAFVSLTIYEDIMSPFMTGSVIISDSLSMTALLPLVGEETIKIEFETPGHEGSQFKFSRLFFLYKMDKNVNFSMKNAFIELCFISMDGFVDMNTRISQTYKGDISRSVNEILTQDVGLNTKRPTIVEKTANNHIHTSNFWSPAQNLYYLAKHALNAENRPNFLFYENRDGFNFVSLDSLYNQRPVMQFVKDQKNRTGAKSSSDGQTIADPMADYARIIDMSSDEMYDYIDRLQCGMYGSTLYHYDIETKRLRHLVKNSRVDYAHPMLNGTNSMTSSAVSNPSAKMLTDVIHRNLYNGTRTAPVDIHMQRMALLKHVESLKTSIRVFGRASYKVGDVFDLLIYANKSVDAGTSDDEAIDKIMSGKYIASAVVHEISRESHYCNIELIRDSYGK